MSELKADFDWVVRKTRQRLLRRPQRPPREPRPPNPCLLVLTGVRGSNGRLLRVRCRCMAEPRSSVTRYFAYDDLGVVATTHEAKILWDKHVREKMETTR